MITYSGRKVNRDLAELPSCEDIAVHLGRICRYAGAVWWPDLAHSALVAFILDEWGVDNPTWAWGLLHDAHEAITGDTPYPWKPVALSVQQDLIDEQLRLAFDLPLKDDTCLRLVKSADHAALIAEAVGLGLPGWPEHYEEENGYPPEVNERHILLVAALAGSSFVLAEHSTRPDSSGVRAFARMLRHIRSGHTDVARAEAQMFVRSGSAREVVR